MKLSRLIFLGILLSTGTLYAQTDFRNGYIITNNEDTIVGQIDYRGDLLMSSICKFKRTDNKTIEYSPDDINAFRFIDSKYYVSREVNNKRVFLEYLIKGQVNIYYMRDEKGDHYYIDREDVRLTEIPYEEGIRFVDGKQFSYKSTRHIGFLSVYMQDAPEFQSQIKKVNKPQHHNLIKLAEDYHNSVCKTEKCIIYGKKLPSLKVNMEAVAGVINFQHFENFENVQIVDNLIDKYYFQTGVIANFWLPRTNEKIYFKTGFLTSQVEDSDGAKYRYLKIPTHLGYLAPNTYRIRPSVSFGLLSPSYSGGVSVRINRTISLGVQSWVNFFPNSRLFIIPNQLINYSLLGNLYIEM